MAIYSYDANVAMLGTIRMDVVYYLAPASRRHRRDAAVSDHTYSEAS